MDASCAPAVRSWRSNLKKRATCCWAPEIGKPSLHKEGSREEDVIATAQLEGYLESFSDFEKRAAGHNLTWLRELRHQIGRASCREREWWEMSEAAVRSEEGGVE